MDLINRRGYNNINDFAEKNNIEFTHIYKSYNSNVWTRKTLDEIGRKMGLDLKSLSTVNVDIDEEFNG